MCGIVGAVAQRPITSILVEGLKRLAYRGYDSAGVAVITPHSNQIDTLRIAGKVVQLEATLHQEPMPGSIGIAHTRWATHGQPSVANAHPHISKNNIAIVHNGIIENHEALRVELQQAGYTFTSETDTEVIVHLIQFYYSQTHDIPQAITQAVARLIGAYALGIITSEQPDTLYAIRHGSPLVVGLGINEHFIASDPLALAPVTQRVIYLQDGDLAIITHDQLSLLDHNRQPVQRPIHESTGVVEATSKGDFRHFMLKEIYEQPASLQDTLGPIGHGTRVSAEHFGPRAKAIFKQTQRIRFVACGTSYHAALVAKHWIETLAQIPCQVEISSEFRYGDPVVEQNTLLVALSQSGETADTLAALRHAKSTGHLATLGICNVAESSLMREADLTFLMHAGPEIGVAATKTFTAQLCALLQLALALCDTYTETHDEILSALNHLPQLFLDLLQLDKDIKRIAQRFDDKQHALFLARHINVPIAHEGALKLKEISYINAQAYAAGELKHGPLALVDPHLPIIVLAPHDKLASKLAANIEEIKSRHGQLIIFAEQTLNWQSDAQSTVINMPHTHTLLTPFIYTVPLQLLAYHVAVIKGTDVDQPRNLAKSVTVE